MALAIPFAFANVTTALTSPDLDGDYAAIVNWINARIPTAGPIGTRPAFGTPGALWVATDVGNTLSIDTGVSWLDTGVPASSLPGTSFFEFTGIATPAAPAAGRGRLYAPSGPAGLRTLGWLDAGGQESIFNRILTREVGNPIKDIVSTTTETSLFTTAPTLKGGMLGSNRLVRFAVLLDYLNNTGGTRAITLRLKYGGVTLATLSGTGILTTATRYGLVVLGYVQAITAASQFVRIHGNFRSNPSTVGVTGATNAMDGAADATGSSSNTGGAVDSTVDQTFDLTAQHDASNANLSVRPYVLYAEVLG